MDGVSLPAALRLRDWPRGSCAVLGWALSALLVVSASPVAQAQSGTRGYDPYSGGVSGGAQSAPKRPPKVVRLPPPIDVTEDNPLFQPLVDVRVEGNVTIHEYVILQEVQTRPGRPASQPQILEDVRSLYDTRWFTQVDSVYRETDEGLVLIFRVVEKPVVRSVQFLGNKKIKTKRLEAETGLKPGAPFDVTINKEAAERIRQLYVEKGYRHVKVGLRKGGDPGDRDVVFHITEGPKVQVRRVVIEGNTFARDAVLKLGKETKARYWFPLHYFGGKYEPETIPNDEQAIIQYYQGLGFFDVDVTSKTYAVNQEKSLIDVVFHVKEGRRFKVRNVEIVGENVVPERRLREPLKLMPNEFFNARYLAADVTSMKDNYDELGRLFARVDAQPVFLEQPGIIDLVYQIDEDRVYYIGDINVTIRGDHPHTTENVVRNQADAYIQPGSLANAANIRKLQSRLLGSHLWERNEPPSVNLRKVEGSNYLSLDVIGRAQSPQLPSRAAHRQPRFGHSVETAQRVPTVIPSSDQQRLQRTESQTVVSFRPINFGHSVAAVDEDESERTWADFKKQIPQQRRPRPPVVQAPLRESTRTNAQRQPAVRLMNEPFQQNGAGVGGPSVSTVGVGPRSDNGPRADMGSRESVDNISGLTPTARRDAPLWEVSPPSLVIRAQSDEVFRAQSPHFRGQSIGPYGQPIPQDYIQGVSPQGDPFGNALRGPGFVDVDIDVTEARTGRLQFGAGVNSDAGVVGSIVLEENNFDISRPPRSFADILNGQAWRGGGQSFRIEAVPGNQVSRYLASWQDPFFLNTDFSFGVSGFYYTRFYEDWDEQRLGGRVTLGRLLGNFWSVNGALRLENVNISDIQAGAPPILTSVRGDNFLSTGRIALSHDTRDSSFLPTQGHYVEGSYEQAFGDFDYSRFELTGSQFFTVYERPDGRGKHIVQLQGQLGWTGDNTPIFERFYAGGFQSFRGFEFRGVTPRQSGVKTGGQFLALGTVEYIAPITADDNIRAVAFSDFGTIENNAGFEEFRVSVGAGIRLTLPALGPAPIALDFAVPLLEEDFDEEQVFSFYVGFTR